MADSLPTTLYNLGALSFRLSPLLAPILIWGMDAPHGRFAPKNDQSWTSVHGNYGWLVMEIVSPLTFVASLLTPFALGNKHGGPILRPTWDSFGTLPLPNRVLAVAFVLHYLHRALISPLTSPTRSRMHISVPISAIGFNLNNGFLLGAWLAGRSPPLPSTSSSSAAAAVGGAIKSFWNTQSTVGLGGPGLIPPSAIQHPLFWLGIAGWAIGFAGNIYHDEILANLRRKPRGGATTTATKAVEKKKSGDGKGKEDAVKSRYKVPHGALFEYVSFPNYLCEWFEWASFTFSALYFLPLFQQQQPQTPLETLSTLLQTPPFLFLLAEVSAMLPRAYKGHRWYRDTFGDEFPKDRKVVVPFVF
ncbi:unnamed protein product [Tilletia laevis]|uniref:3-oxo-5-alpha-steroid 4-dehydrogenase C-terminal domain-containing protein n=2 Tax=Tilletia TaxID=13289 RepID=A0A9N8QD47_9BASI|nr:hypothetical protein CF335_g4505 [Tilletia laevis]KAE8257013.1 hypothetical protein A4X03_0g4834 [Tilletia caries]CAD6907108.1 unnamed protein product [Tilletia caries]CAD6920388.1 unnamed protein product [Tilletia laevis]